MENLYTWDEIYNITQNSEGRIYALPLGVDKYQNSLFELTEICIDDIPKQYFTLEECILDDFDEDELVIRRLIRAYESYCEVPPIILDKDLNIIDGCHRLGAMHYLRYAYIKAFVEM